MPQQRRCHDGCNQGPFVCPMADLKLSNNFIDKKHEMLCFNLQHIAYFNKATFEYLGNRKILLLPSKLSEINLQLN
jgi:hypothetical protein